MFDISVGIVSYNNHDTVSECLDSLFKTLSGRLSMQVFVVNNSQTDSLDDLKEKFPVQVIPMSENVGFGKGHNALLPLIDSRYHAVVNPDVIFVEDVFDKLFDFLESDPKIGCVAPLMYSADGKLQDVYRRELSVVDLLARYSPDWLKRLSAVQNRCTYHVMSDIDKTVPFECEFIQGSFLVMPSELFRELEGFDERFFMYAEDADLCKRIRKMHRIVECFPDCKVVHKWERASHRNFKLFRIHFASLVKYFCKHSFTNRGGKWLPGLELVPQRSYSWCRFACAGRAAA